MNPDKNQLQMLRNLILKSQCESLSDSEVTELNSLICAEGGALEAAALIDQLGAFADSASPSSLLISEVLSGAMGNDTTLGEFPSRADLASRASARSPSKLDQQDTDRSARWTKVNWLLAIVASNLIVASWAWSLAKSLSTDPQATQIAAESAPQSESSSVQLVSTSPQLVSMTACVWRPSGDAVPTLGKPLQSGEILNLIEGIAELKIGEGTHGEALVRIEGPARAYVRADGQLGILKGSMTVKSLGTGSGNVTVDTPLSTVLVDGQSSIGLIASDSDCEIHLFTGKTLVKPHQIGLAEPEIHLDEGEAVRLSSQSGEEFTVVKFEASEANFVSSRSPGFDPLSMGEEYVHAVLESNPSIYWRFEELKGESPQFVENQGSAPGMNAIVRGNPAWRQYGTNRVAELGMSTASAFRALDPWPAKPLEEYSIEVWVKPLLLHHGEVICLHDVNPLDDGRYQHTMMLETVAQHYFTNRLKGLPVNRFRFVHRKFGEVLPISATSLFAEKEYQARVWQHVVTQRRGGRQMLWIDGQLAAEHPNPAPLSENAQVLVGQVYPDSLYRRFVGQIDEIAIYDRALTPLEMRTHIRAAGRKVAPKPKK